MKVVDSTLTNRLLDAVGQCLTPSVARKLIQLRASPEDQARVGELAEKCNEGQLTAQERAEYEAYIVTSNFIAILQSKARTLLARAKRVP